MSAVIRVLIADDHTIVRSGLRLLLDAESDIMVVGEALDGQEALLQTDTLRPDVVLMDISMSGMDGLEATRQIVARWPNTRVLVLTMHREDEFFLEMIKAGAAGYIVKGADPVELLAALRTVHHGGVYLYPAVAGKLVRAYLKRLTKEEDKGPHLSARETEVLILLAQGYSNKEIAEQLVISQSTVHTHRGNLMGKLGLESQHALIQYARDQGLI